VDRFGPVPEPVEGLFTAVRVRLAAEAAAVPDVRVDAGRVTFRWPHYDRAAVVRTLMLAGFRPVDSSNQLRVPVPPGRDPVDTALRALAALTP
jgi:transcription-repair coupling factor (superfamily II helicase)